MLNVAKVQYPGAPNDFSALVNMMGDEQKTQNNDIDDLDHHNMDQDQEINHEEDVNIIQADEIEDLRNRLDKLEGNNTTTESIKEAAPNATAVQDVVGRLNKAGGTIYNDITLVKGDEIALLGGNTARSRGGDGNSVKFAIFQDGSFKRAREFTEFERDGWKLVKKEAAPKDKINFKLLARKIEEAVQMSFPDSDPLNQLMHYSDQLERNGLTLMDALDQATQKYLGANNYNDYLATFWDDYAADNLDPDMDQSNPWRESIGEAGQRETKQNWFETLNAALESESLLNTWDITMSPISYGENRSYNAVDDEGQCRHISIYRETDGRYERPVHYSSKGC
jgi:hypothetical protein